MATRALQVIGLLCLVTAITLGVIAAGIENARYQGPDDSSSGDTQAKADLDEERQATIRVLVMIAAPTFLIGLLACWLVWRRHGSPDSVLHQTLRVPGGRYSAAKLCLRQRSSRRSRSSMDETFDDSETH